ncbi:transposable element Tc1 transposase [Trichonephila clavipes]|nr:transposable element Tc1 transposase [Trichonephila clavipes]
MKRYAIHSPLPRFAQAGSSGFKLQAGRCAVLLARWIVRSVPLETIESSGHEKVLTRGKQGLGTDDNSVRVCRSPGERCNSLHNVLRHTARTACVMVWGTIAYDSRSTLIVMRGTLTGQRYIEDIHRPPVGSFLNGLPQGQFSSKIMLSSAYSKSCSRLPTSFADSSMAGPLPRFVPCRARVGSAKMADAIVSLCTGFRVGCSRFVGPSASGQHKVSNQLNAGPCGGMYCSWRWSNALLKLPSICVVAHPVIRLIVLFLDQVNL